jgi:serine/threonine-protein kinase
MGSPQYMSPEQMVSAAKADQRSDIWSLGTVLYELLTGRIAFEGSSMTAICARVLQGDPEPLTLLRPDIPLDLAAVLGRCFEKVPAARYATVAELARALAPFGTTRARASAESITRVMEGVTSATPPCEPRVPSSASLSTIKPTAAEILAAPPTTGRRMPRYLVGGLVAAASVCALLGYGARTGRLTALHTPEVSVAQGASPLPALPALPAAPVLGAVAPPPVAVPLPAVAPAEPMPVKAPRAPAPKPHRAGVKAIAPHTSRAADAGIPEEVGPYDDLAVPDGTAP